MALTHDEAVIQKQAAVAILEFLALHGVATFQQVQEHLPVFDEKTLLRGIAMASSKGGLCISINKRLFGLTPNFSVVDVPERTIAVIAILRREIQFAEKNAGGAAPKSSRVVNPSSEVVTTLCPFSIRHSEKVQASRS